MMLHEAVMFEIYRQALNARELAASPTRCLSRNSRDSNGGDRRSRSPSDESLYSGRGLSMASPMGMALPATLPPAAAAALLPPQSAAMAAYLGAAAAAAAQQNRLFLNSAASLSGLESVSTLLASPGLAALTEMSGPPILDFSAKHISSSSSNKSDLVENSGGGSNRNSDNNDKSINSRSDEDEEEEEDEEAEADDEPMMMEDRDDEMMRSDGEEQHHHQHDNDDDNNRSGSVGVVNLSNKSTAKKLMTTSSNNNSNINNTTNNINSGEGGGGSGSGNNNSPLDLSVSSSRKRGAPIDNNLALLSSSAATNQSAGGGGSSSSSSSSPGAAARKLSRLMDGYKQQWPYAAAAAAAAAANASNSQYFVNSLNSLTSPKGAGTTTSATADWNGASQKMKLLSGPTTATNDATKALEKMSELSRLGGSGSALDHSSTSPPTFGKHLGSGGGMGQQSTGRHSAWQSHWLNKGADSAKDVLKCVWCKQSFTSLAALTTHMKETKHCGVNMPPSSSSSNASQGLSSQGSSQQQQQQSHHHQHHHHQSHHHNQSSHHQQARDRDSGGGGSNNKSDLNLLIKETMPLPRKLVRGQDVWLGKGAEQTRQILKCMWCGQSFRSLAEMTSHMQQTQHYTNIISQEQIISWKSSEDGGAAAKSGSSSTAGTPSASGPSSSGPSGAGPTGPSNAGATNSTVSAVLTCKVCDQAFSSLKDLSNHMVKNAHYKEHIMRSITESGSRRRQTREKRKKSLPVRKLLELERAQHDFKNGTDMSAIMSKTMREAASGRITCEKCGDKIDTALFVEHIRQCVGGVAMQSPHSRGGNAHSMKGGMHHGSESVSPIASSGRKSTSNNIHDDGSMTSPIGRLVSPNVNALNDRTTSPKEAGGGDTDKVSSSPSVLNAIEQLIEKSFDTRSRHGSNSGGANVQQGASTPLGASILKRLGIDESVDYTKPLIDPQTMNLLRTYQQQHSQMFGGGIGGGGNSGGSGLGGRGARERSGSESSSFSDRASSRMDTMTPDRKYEPFGPSSSSVHSRQSPESKNESDRDDPTDMRRNIKREPAEEEHDMSERHRNSGQVRVKREVDDDNGNVDDGTNAKKLSSPHCSPQRRTTPLVVASPTASPASDRSATPRSISSSTPTEGAKAKGNMNSLGALSSMFDNLTGSNNTDPSLGPNAGSSSKDGKKKASHHPLAALQKLCDKTETNQPNARTNSASSNHHHQSSPSLAASANNLSVSSSSSTGGTNAGSGILAFSWACNDAVMTGDSIMKCAFCDTPFISKGAYRHHLSKMHFVKDEALPDSVAIKQRARTPTTAKSPTPPAMSPKAGANGLVPGGTNSGSSSSSNNNNNNNANNSSSNAAKSPASATPTSTTPTPNSTGVQFEESPHSKFLKYTELAKQLSSKYV